MDELTREQLAHIADALGQDVRDELTAEDILEQVTEYIGETYARSREAARELLVAVIQAASDPL